MKKKHVLLSILILIYLVGFLLCKFYFAQGMPMESYTAAWLFRYSFMYTWIIVILFAVFNKPFTAISTTIGCFLGIVIGDILGEWIRTVRIEKVEVMIQSGIEVSKEVEAQAHYHFGVFPIWFSVIILLLIVGLIVDQMLKHKVCL